MMYIPFFTIRKRRKELRRQFNEWKLENYPSLSDEEAAKIFFAPIIELNKNILAMFSISVTSNKGE